MVLALQRLGPQDLQVVIVGDQALVPLRCFMMNTCRVHRVRLK